VDEAVREYIEAIPSEHRPMFDRLHGLILEAHPDATVTLSYGIPTYRVGRRRLFVGAWNHGLSVYGWQADHDAGSAPGKSKTPAAASRCSGTTRRPDGALRADSTRRTRRGMHLRPGKPVRPGSGF
jgi:hypothetical protein